MTSKSETRQDIYSRITDQIAASLEKGIKPWTQPWNSGHAAGPVSRPHRFNGETYSGINVLTLWASAMERSFAAPIWMTFRQAQELGGHVRKGETGSPVVYANSIVRTEVDDANGNETDVTIPFMKGYTVFNVEQIDGPAKPGACPRHQGRPRSGTVPQGAGAVRSGGVRAAGEGSRRCRQEATRRGAAQGQGWRTRAGIIGEI